MIIANRFDKGLFPGGSLGNKHLIYIEDGQTIEWLKREFAITYLTYQHIAEEIEQECENQLNNKNTKFFQNLYNYARDHEQFKISGRKVLLTDNWTLVSNDADVFYGGMKNKVVLPASITQHINFIHRDIKIADLREGKSRIGIIEYSVFELVKRLLKLFTQSIINREEILNVLVTLELDQKSEVEIRNKIELPIIGLTTWVSTLYNPVYFQLDPLVQLYPTGKFVDKSIFNDTHPQERLEQFLMMCGVWNIPAVYLKRGRNFVGTNESRDSKFASHTGRFTRPFNVINDRVLDKPTHYTAWFTNSIIENWDRYTTFIGSFMLPPFQFLSAQANNPVSSWSAEITLQLSSFLESLKNEPWIMLSGNTTSLLPSEVVGIDPHDTYQSHNVVIKKHLHILPINFVQRKGFIQLLNLIHLDGDTIINFESLLKLIYVTYQNDNYASKEFTDFYNRILGRLFEFFFFRSQQMADLTGLKKIHFLAMNEITKTNEWAQGSSLLYLDDKPNYDLLPTVIKEQLQPHFTNRDKNTFGKLATKIGRKFSTSIHKELIQEEPVRTHELSTFFPQLPEYLALFENSVDTVLGKELDQLKAVQVLEKSRISIKVIVNKIVETEITLDHFVDADSKYDVHLLVNHQEAKKIAAEALSELMTKLLDRDIKRYNLELLRLMNAPDALLFLKEYDITEERIQQIRDKIYTNELTPEQRFWDAILTCKGIQGRDSFLNDTVQETELAKQVGITLGNLQAFRQAINFAELSETGNITHLTSLLNNIAITLADINQHILPKIDFSDYYNNQLRQLKNKFQKPFEAELHAYLKTQDRSQQETYQTQIDSYKYQFTCTVPKNCLVPDLAAYFLEQISHQYTFKLFDSTILASNYENFNSVAIYNQQVENLIKLLSTAFDSVLFDRFILTNTVRSLLYFDHTEHLADRFLRYLKDQQAKEPDLPTIPNASSEESYSDDLDGFNDDIDNHPAEHVDTKSIAPSQGNSGGGGWGRRWDGEDSEVIRKKIGIVAETATFLSLKKIYKHVIWASANAKKVDKGHPGFNPEGEDGLGYDIEYLDEENNKYYIEVKGRSDATEAFELTKTEISKGYAERKFYKVFFVSYALDPKRRKIRDLGLLFDLKPGEDFLSNSKFTALNKNFEIKFK